MVLAANAKQQVRDCQNMVYVTWAFNFYLLKPLAVEVGEDRLPIFGVGVWLPIQSDPRYPLPSAQF